MRGKTWFGTRGNELWVPTFTINPAYGRSGFSSTTEGINGLVWVRDSKNAHNTYVLEWTPRKRDDMRPISDFADGVYDDQDDVNLIYWIDKMAADKNVLSQAWAVPVLGAEDARPLVSDQYERQRPTASATPTNAARYPKRAATFTQTSTSVTLEQYIPIPPGFSAWVGVHGDGAAAGRVVIQPVNGYADVGSPIVPTVLGLVTTRVNTEIPSGVASGIVLKFAATVSPVTFTLYGLVVQILPTGQVPEIGDFISGQGHSGCQFEGKPAKTPYSSALDRVAMTARLVETGMGL